jgi:hypothetical protein
VGNSKQGLYALNAFLLSDNMLSEEIICNEAKFCKKLDQKKAGMLRETRKCHPQQSGFPK